VITPTAIYMVRLSLVKIAYIYYTERNLPLELSFHGTVGCDLRQCRVFAYPPAKSFIYRWYWKDIYTWKTLSRFKRGSILNVELFIRCLCLELVKKTGLKGCY